MILRETVKVTRQKSNLSYIRHTYAICAGRSSDSSRFTNPSCRPVIKREFSVHRPHQETMYNVRRKMGSVPPPRARDSACWPSTLRSPSLVVQLQQQSRRFIWRNVIPTVLLTMV
ncbi:hypothetical protein CSOJ01_11190 [Colletotrichum sojae]|uniref:Uncharacterized protein n=1 Tax=Colletotrichum sojae TaxID=2175907 RepID=A0A8H6IYX4_9PEZI|nr:hypothetical protein CSOJ01_11190 [Colletotrichum sojae]